MKKAVVFFFTLNVFSCTNNANEIQDSSLIGEWTLTNVICFCGFPEDPNFEATQITFRSSENTMVVKNTGEFEWFIPEGTYTYSGQDNRITLENGRTYDFVITGDVLRIIFVGRPNIADEGVTYYFERS